jgi:hypothetical protein
MDILLIRYTQRLSIGSLLFFLGQKKHCVPYEAIVIYKSGRKSKNYKNLRVEFGNETQ